MFHDGSEVHRCQFQEDLAAQRAVVHSQIDVEFRHIPGEWLHIHQERTSGKGTQARYTNNQAEGAPVLLHGKGVLAVSQKRGRNNSMKVLSWSKECQTKAVLELVGSRKKVLSGGKRFAVLRVHLFILPV